MGYYDRLINEHVNKYENYYPITPCIQDKNTPNKKHHSMCSYCYSCYNELCETISDYFEFSIDNKHKFISIVKICNKANIISKNRPDLCLREGVKKIVNVINKYTNYSKTKKEGFNLLHREFIESLMIPLEKILLRYYTQEEYGFTNWNKRTLKENSLYYLNIFCLDMWIKHSYLKTGFTYESEYDLYYLVKSKN